MLLRWLLVKSGKHWGRRTSNNQQLFWNELLLNQPLSLVASWAGQLYTKVLGLATGSQLMISDCIAIDYVYTAQGSGSLSVYEVGWCWDLLRHHRKLSHTPTKNQNHPKSGTWCWNLPCTSCALISESPWSNVDPPHTEINSRKEVVGWSSHGW